MSKFSGDLEQGGIAKEAVRGTFVPPQYNILWEDFSIVDKAIIAQDGSRSGILEDARNSHVVGTAAEGDASGPVRDRFIGLPLLSMFGTVTDALVQTSVYDHTFDMQASNQKQSLAIYKKSPNGGQDHALCMVNKLELSVNEKGLAEFSMNVRGLARASQTLGVVTITVATPGVVTLVGHKLATGDAITLATTGGLPTGLTAGTTYYVVKVDADTFSLATTLANALAATKITTSSSQSGVHTASMATTGRYLAASAENVFRQQDCTFKLAATQSGLGAASAINVRSAKLTLDGGVEDDRTIGSVAAVDVLNTHIMGDLEVELVMNDESYITALLAGTAYAARLDFNNSTVTIGASSNPRLYFDCYRVVLQDAPVKFQKGKITLVTLKLKVLYSEADAYSVRAILRNTVAAY